MSNPLNKDWPCVCGHSFIEHRRLIIVDGYGEDIYCRDCYRNFKRLKVSAGPSVHKFKAMSNLEYLELKYEAESSGK